mmetsp:Transcript_49961/g.87944  ORF Transcript_49961/g.87944 Transcript_49961/m.87944 type:complete len:539 (+) Transcript_49961:77-1693(+)
MEAPALAGDLDASFEGRVLQVFQKWDVRQAGHINAKDMERILTDIGLERHRVPEIFAKADADRSGVIDYREFIAWICSGGDEVQDIRQRWLGTRLMVVERPEDIRTCLRKEPKDDKGDNFMPGAKLANGTRVKIIEPSFSAGPENGYVRVQFRDKAPGWIRQRYLDELRTPPERYMQVAETLHLRKEPREEDGENLKEVCIEAGHFVEVLQEAENRHCKVHYWVDRHCESGWLEAKKLRHMTIEKMMKVASAKYGRKTSLRARPVDDLDGGNKKDLSLHVGMVTEVVDPTRRMHNGYVEVCVAGTGMAQDTGWIRAFYLECCPDVGRLAGLDVGGSVRKVVKRQLRPGKDGEFAKISKMVENSVCHDKYDDKASHKCKEKYESHGVTEFKVQDIWLLEGHYFEKKYRHVTGELLFHGCPDDVVPLISETGGFDLSFLKRGSFGHGLYFTTQACKAWQYGESHILLCHVKLGDEGQRLVVEKDQYDLDEEEVCNRLGKYSVEARRLKPYGHEERIIYTNTQVIVYAIIKMTQTHARFGK